MGPLLIQNIHRPSLSSSIPGLHQSRPHQLPGRRHPHQNRHHHGSRSSTLSSVASHVLPSKSVSDGNMTNSVKANDTSSMVLYAPSGSQRSVQEASDADSSSAVETPTFVRLAPYFESIPNRKYTSLSRMRQQQCVNLATDPSLRSLHSMDDLRLNGILSQTILEDREPITEVREMETQSGLHGIENHSGGLEKLYNVYTCTQESNLVIELMVIYQQLIISYRSKSTEANLHPEALGKQEKRNPNYVPLQTSPKKQNPGNQPETSKSNAIPILITTTTSSNNTDNSNASSSNPCRILSRLWRYVLVTGGLSLFIIVLGTTLATEAGYQGPLVMRFRDTHLFTNWEAYFYYPLRSLLLGMFQ
ncbi:hypothetical protein ACTXT7_000424 [Hymenolepis weldensis]